MSTHRDDALSERDLNSAGMTVLDPRPRSVARWATSLLAAPLALELAAIGFLTRNADSQPSPSGGTGVLAIETIVFATIYAFALVQVILYAAEARKLLFRSPILLVFFGFVALTAFWSLYPARVVMSLGHHLGALLIVISAALAARRSPAAVPIALMIGSGLVLVASIAVIWADPAYGIDELRESRWRGVTGNPNTLGVFALAAVISFVWHFYEIERQKLRVLPTFVLLSSIVCLYGSNSTTSTILALILLFGVPPLMWSRRLVGIPLPVRVLLFGVPFSGFALVLYIIMPEMFDYRHALSMAGRDASFTGRGDIWALALEISSARPWFGWSFDSHASVQRVLAIDVGQFHNGYLDVLVKGGLVGLFLISTLLALLIARLWRLRRVKPTVAIVLGAVVMVILIHNITEASLGRGRSVLWILLLYSVLVSGVQYRQRKRSS